ncbi:MAG: flagellar hook-associated protein FlgK [Burkholderiaceae bacterium]
MSASSVFGIALTGLSAAKAGISTVSHNISNVNNKDFTRQTVVQNASAAQSFSFGYVGQGVQIMEVRRNYSDFLGQQVMQSNSDASFYSAYNNQISKVDNLFADSNAGLSSALTDFFNAVQDLSTQPNDSTSRQNLLSTSGALANRFNSLSQAMTDLRSGTNAQVATSVTSINSLTSQIAEVNKQVVFALNQGLGGGPPNDLLDKRDALIKELSGQVQTTIVKQNDGALNVFLGNGQAVVIKDKNFNLVAERDPSNPEDMQIGLRLNEGTVNEKIVQFAPGDLGTGALSGYLKFREGPLAKYQNGLGLIAAQLGAKMNEINQSGVDQVGNPGLALFNSTGNSRAVSRTNNAGDAQVSVTSLDLSKLPGDDYELTVKNGALAYRKLGTGDDFVNLPPLDSTTPPTYQLDGSVTFTLNGTPAEGDRYILMPTRDAAKNLKVIATLPGQLATAKLAASPGDNSNVLEMAALQNTDVLYQFGTSAKGFSLSAAYNQLVSQIGNKTREIQTATAAREAVLDQNTQALQSASGVNLDEEAADLLKYQQAYQAAGRVISLSKELFDTVVSLMSS